MGGRKADGCKQCSCPAPKMAQPLRHFFRKRMRINYRSESCFNPHPPVGGRVQLQQAFAMHGAFQRLFQSSPARRGGCNPYPQHTPSASVVASGWSVGREWGWIQMEQMERQFGKSHLRRVFWGFFGSICSICSICSMRAARQKSPAFEIIHNGRCIPAKLGCYSARINQSNPSLKTPP